MVSAPPDSSSIRLCAAASAAAGVTLCYVDGEYLSYSTATMTATSKYGLTGLYRALGGSSASAHASGAAFCLLDSAILPYDIPASQIGSTVTLKLQSFNIFGGGLQDISTCVAYPYTVHGTGLMGPVASALAVGAALDYGHVSGDAIAESDDLGNVSSPATTIIDLGNVTSS